MKKISLAIALFLSSLIAGAQTFTVNNVSGSGQNSWDLDAIQIGCNQKTMPPYTGPHTTGTFFEALQQANLGNIKKIVFAPGVSNVDLSSRWQQVTILCASGVKITADHPVTIKSALNTSYKAFTVTGTNDTIENITFQDAYLELNGTSTYLYNNTFISTQTIVGICLFNTSKNKIEKNTFTKNNGSGNNSAIRLGTNQSETIWGVTGNDTIINNTATGFWNGVEVGRWNNANPTCNNLLIKGNSFYSNRNTGIYLIASSSSTVDSNFVYGNIGGGLSVETSSDNVIVKQNKIHNNSAHGISVISSNNILINANEIYGNSTNGISISTSNSSNVTNNKIGIDNLGNISGNRYNGIEILGGQNHRIGKANNGNIIVASGNGTFNDNILTRNNGIRFGIGGGVLPTNSSIKSNYIGVDENGTQSVALGSNRSGIFFDTLAALSTTYLNDTIGGNTMPEANIVGNNGTSKGAGTAGININNFNSGILIVGNYVGISNKLTSISNYFDGILIRGANHNQVINNKVGYNSQGISIRYNVTSLGTASAQSLFNVVKGNYCGTSNGIDSHPNIDCGLSIEWGSNNNRLGGTGVGDTNIVMNEKIGIWVAGPNVFSTKDTIWGNKISNCSTAGILLANSSSNLVINGNIITSSAIGMHFAGTVTNASVTNNTINQNTSDGISIAAAITNSTFTNNTITNTKDGNGINVSAAAENIAIRNNTITGNKYLGAGLQPSKGNGIYMTLGKTSIIGGTGANEGNIIADNATDGISLNGIAVNGVMMRRNSITCNGGTGINLNSSANTNYMFDILEVDTTSSTVNSISGLLKKQTNKDVIIEVYGPSIACKQSCSSDFGRQGSVYLGTTTTDASGKWTLTLASPIALTDVPQLTATATTPTALNVAGAGFVTSEFSRCSDILPVEFLSFTVTKVQNGVALIWKTATETNNAYFIVEHSTDGIHFTPIGSPVKGAGTTLQTQSYKFLDIDPANGLNYYQIRQVDLDGKYDFSTVEVVNLTGESMVTVSPNPSHGHFSVKIIAESSSLFTIDIYNALGQAIYTKSLSVYGGFAEQKVILNHVAAGVYTLVVKNDTDSWVEKIIKE